jgi:hypothetical protein
MVTTGWDFSLPSFAAFENTYIPPSHFHLHITDIF